MKPRMKHTGTRILGLTLSAALLLSSAACGAGENGSSALNSGCTSSGSSAKGRYVEEEYPLPGGEENSALNLTETDGALRLLTYDGLFDSADGGKTWTEGASALKDPKKAGTPFAWGPGGSAVYSANGDDGLTHYWLVGKDGSEKELVLDLPENKMFAEGGFSISGSDSVDGAAAEGTEVPAADSEKDEAARQAEKQMMANSIQKFAFLSDGSLLGLDQNGTIYQIDPENGSFLRTLETTGEQNQYTNFVLTKNTLVAQSYEGIDLYSLSDWKPQERDSVLEEAVNGGGKNAESNSGAVTTVQSSSAGGSTLYSGETRIFADGTDDSVYLSSNGGVYRHILGGSSVEQVINGALNSLSDPSLYVQDMIRTSDGSFLALAWKESDNKHRVLNYTYDPNMSSMPEKELKAYALSDSTELRQAIAMYQKANPDVYINLELGLSGNDAMTASDALRTLNTNIMADKGPDVIFLDGMRVQNYLDQGLLADISDIVKETADSEGLFDNIVSAYQKDGGYYAVPTRFTTPILNADTGVLDSVKDLSTLADAVEKLRKENADLDTITGLTDPLSLLIALHPASSPAWIKEDGTLDQEALTDFLRQAKRLFDTNKPAKEENSSDMMGYVTFAAAAGTMVGVDLLEGKQLIELNQFSSVNSLTSLVTVLDKLKNYGYAAQAGQSSNVFAPGGIVGVSAKSALPEEAKAFVKYLLSSEAQKVDQGQGMPVNQTAFDALAKPENASLGGMAVMSSDGSATIELTFRAPTAEEYAALKEMVQKLNTPSLLDNTILDAVLESGKAFLNGESELDAAVQDIMKKVNLYLSE